MYFEKQALDTTGLVTLGLLILVLIYIGWREINGWKRLIKTLKKGDTVFKGIIDGEQIHFKQSSAQYTIEEIDSNKNMVLLKNSLTSGFVEVHASGLKANYKNSEFKDF